MAVTPSSLYFPETQVLMIEILQLISFSWKYLSLNFQIHCFINAFLNFFFQERDLGFFRATDGGVRVENGESGSKLFASLVR